MRYRNKGHVSDRETGAGVGWTHLRSLGQMRKHRKNSVANTFAGTVSLLEAVVIMTSFILHMQGEISVGGRLAQARPL